MIFPHDGHTPSKGEHKQTLPKAAPSRICVCTHYIFKEEKGFLTGRAWVWLLTLGRWGKVRQKSPEGTVLSASPFQFISSGATTSVGWNWCLITQFSPEVHSYWAGYRLKHHRPFSAHPEPSLTEVTFPFCSFLCCRNRNHLPSISTVICYHDNCTQLPCESHVLSR